MTITPATTTAADGWTPPGVAAAPARRDVAGIAATLVGTQAVTSVLGFLYWTIAARRFSVPSVGLASAATSTMQLLGSFGMLGFGTLLIARLPATPPERRRVLVRSSLLVVVVASAAIGAVFALCVGLIPSGGLRGLASGPVDAGLLVAGIALTGGTLVIDQAVLSAGSGLVQFERNVVASAAKIGFLIALSLGGAQGGMSIYLSWVLGTVVSLPVVLLRTENPHVRIAPPRWLDRSVLRGTWREAASHHTLNLALQAPLMLFPAVITLGSSARSTGYFATVLLFSGFVFVLPYAVSIGLFASSGTDAASLRRRMRVTVPFGVAASLLADAVLIPFAPMVLRIFGSGYAAHGTTALRLIVLAGLPFVIKDHYVALRRVERRTAAAARVALATAVAEVAAAVVGELLGATTGLCVAWLAVVYAEALIIGVVLRRDLRSASRSGSGTATVAAGPTSAPEDVRPRLSPARPRAAGGSDGIDGMSPPVSGPWVFAMTVGVAVEGLASLAGNRGVTPAAVDALFWGGLVLVFVPAAWRILSPRTTNAARAGFVLALGLLLQISRFALFPTQFVAHDELAHQNTLRLIDTGHRLFLTNPLLPVSSYYPGLELVTEGIHSLLGLPERGAAIVVLVAARVVMTLAVYLGVARVTRSSRWGAVASLCYVCNEQYLFFNSQYSYQTLALPLALFTVWTVLRLLDRADLRRRDLLLPLAGIGATVVSHHLTSMVLVGTLLLWAFLARHFLGREGRPQVMAQLGSAGLVLVLVWALVPGNPVLSYLTQIGGTSWSAIRALVEGGRSHALFEAGGYRTPAWEVLVSVVSELVVVVALVLALRRFWREKPWRVVPVALILGLAALAFPVVPAGHLTGATSEVTDRASGFLFVGVGLVVGGWLLARREVWERSAGRRFAVLAAFTAAFVGQTILGSGPQFDQTPGSFLVSSDARSIDRWNLAAAHWEAAHLPAGTRVIADRDGSLLAGAVGGMYPVSHIADGINGSPILLSPTWTGTDEDLLRRLRIDYVIVDERDASGLPRLGVYYESGEYDQNRTAPVPLSALTKFARVPGVRVAYAAGPIVIYDVRSLLEVH